MIYTPLGTGRTEEEREEERKEEEDEKEEVIPKKRAKWKIRGDYRGSGALTFGRNSAGRTRGWLTCVSRR